MLEPERRKKTRAQLETAVQLKRVASVDAGELTNSFSQNISEQGMAITTFDFYPVQSRVHVKILSKTWANLLEIIARVVWVRQLPYQQKYRVGLAFVDVSDDAKRQVNRLAGSKLI